MKEEHTLGFCYQGQVDLREKQGFTQLGLTTNLVWHVDPRRLLFVLARYKFVSKMLSGKKSALEVGCGDAFGTRIVMQEVPRVVGIDIDPVFVRDVNARMDSTWRFECRVHDILQGPVEDGPFEAAYSLDVLEHIRKEDEHLYVANIAKSLTEDGVLIVGSPSLQSQPFASPPSKAGHINCKRQEEFKALMLDHFHNVFMFSMNDEMVHTGFHELAHYAIALCAGKRSAI